MEKERRITAEVESYFENVVGMEEAKKSFQLFQDALGFQKIRESHGYTEPIVKNMNFIICGDRGVGKTLLAKLLAQYIKDIGQKSDYEVLSIMARIFDDPKMIGRIHELRSQSKKIVIIENVDEYLQNADILDSERRDFVLLLSEVMMEAGQDKIFIITGSSAGIESMRNYDPTLENHIFDTIQIKNYTTEELWQMMQIMADENQLHVDEGCGGLVKNKLSAQTLMAGFLNGTIIERYKNDSAKRLASNYYALEQPDDERALLRIDEDSIPFKDTSERLQKRLDELDGLTGLKMVKKKVSDQLIKMKVALENEQMGVGGRRKQTLHMIFKGNPGTGKTTVARILGDIYCEMGLLPNGDQGVKTVSRAELVGQYFGETAQRVKKICENADGGVLFIDEAYSLINSEQDSFGHEAVDTLIQEMENRRDSLMVIFAGYSEEIDEFLKANPGFRSRIPETNELIFEDYNLEEMVDIFKGMISHDGYVIDIHSVSDEMIGSLIETRSKNPGFGNARGIRNLVQDVEDEVDLRVAQIDEMAKQDASVRRLSSFERKLVGGTDMESACGKKLEGEKTIEELLDEMEKYVGLDGVKKQVRDIVRSVEYEDILKSKGIEPKKRTKTMHLIFSGNPGTGKSTIAAKLGEIYVKLGVLRKNTFVLAKRENLVGQYQGHTAAQVASKVAEADGGILFIDEAYQLCLDEHDSFGMEAIGTLLSLAEEKRDSLMIVLAGYKDDMESFLKTNSGLKSRFPHVIEFEDYSIDELVKIFEFMCENDGMKCDDDAKSVVRSIIEQRRSADLKEFGNARGVRNIFDEIVIRQNSRIVSDKANIDIYTEDDLFTIKKVDVEGGLKK